MSGLEGFVSVARGALVTFGVLVSVGSARPSSTLSVDVAEGLMSVSAGLLEHPARMSAAGIARANRSRFILRSNHAVSTRLRDAAGCQ